MDKLIPKKTKEKLPLYFDLLSGKELVALDKMSLSDNLIYKGAKRVNRPFYKHICK